jgi:hypothetical protein
MGELRIQFAQASGFPLTNLAAQTSEPGANIQTSFS